jgi:gamma-glutamyltranspeptidase
MALCVGLRAAPSMRVRGEQFWLDKTRAAQLRPRARPRYTLTPSIVLRDGQPFMAIGSPGGDNQEQTILQAFLDVVEFWPDWYPNLHEAFEWPRVQTLHFCGSFWPHNTGFNRLNLEANIPDTVYNDLKARGHDVAHPRLRHERLRHCRADRSFDRQPHCRRGPPAELLRHRVLVAFNVELPKGWSEPGRGGS